MSRNKSNLKNQFMQKLDSLSRIGHSKHDEQIKNQKLGLGYKSDFIHSVRTLTLYKDEASRFASWLKASNLSYGSINSIPRETIKDYLKTRSSLSAWTSHLSMSALNKLLCENFTTSELGYKSRRCSNIHNNRGLSERQRPGLILKYHDEIQFLKGFGFRRSTIPNLNMSSFVYNSSGYIESLKTIEKGGKLNYYYLLPEFRTFVTSYVNDFYSSHSPTEILFKDFDKSRHLNTHSFRNEYSCNLYLQLLSELKAPEDIFFKGSDFITYGIDSDKLLNALSSSDSSEYHSFNRYCVALTSQALGHYRLDVVASHYLRF